MYEKSAHSENIKIEGKPYDKNARLKTNICVEKFMGKNYGGENSDCNT